MIVELLYPDGTSILQDMTIPSPTTFLIINPNEGEMRRLIALGQNPTREMEGYEWWALDKVVGGTPIYTRGFDPRDKKLISERG